MRKIRSRVGGMAAGALLLGGLIPLLGPASPASAAVTAPQITVFSVTGTVGTYTPPPGATMLHLDVAGAVGGDSQDSYDGYPVNGGDGAHVTADVPITASQYAVEVGAPGSQGPGTCASCQFVASYGGTPGGGNGGGASAVSQLGALAGPLVVAGGGGGAAASADDVSNSR